MRAISPISTSSIGLASSQYVYAIQPLADDHATYLALCSDDTLRAFSVRNAALELEQSVITRHGGATQLATMQVNNRTAILTAGNDGSIKVWDLATNNGTGPPAATMKAKSSPLLSLARCAATSMVATGTELTSREAAIYVWDLRSPLKPILQYNESHSDDVTELHYHPHIPSTLLSGSSDGLVNIYNTSLSDEDDAVIQVFNHGASVHHANFLSNDVVYAISNDEQLSFYMVANSENEFTHESGGEDEVPESWAFGDVRPALDCEYVVDLASKPEGLVIYAGSTRERRLDVVPIKQTPAWDFRNDNGTRLADAGEEVVRTVCFDSANHQALAGGEDGKIRLWSLYEGDDIEMEDC